MGNLAFGPIQLRIAEGLTLLPLVETAAITRIICWLLGGKFTYPLFQLWSNRYIRGGSLVTLIAAYLTSKMPNKVLAHCHL